jgi:hypothetical protein
MRNILALLAAGLLAFAGLGWYLGWYHVQSTPTSDGHREIKVDLDTKKITEDVSKDIKQGSQKLDEIVHPKGGQSQSSIPPPVGTSSSVPANIGEARFRVNPDGTLSYSGEVSVPAPISKGN